MISKPVQLTSNDAPVFWLIIAQLLWAPIPLASNRTWAVGILLLITCTQWITASWCYREQWGAVFQRLKLIKLPVILFVLITFLAFLQTIPLPVSIASVLAPETARIWSRIWPEGPFYLSVNPSQTQLQAALCFIYASTFILTTISARNSRRLMTIAYALIGAAVFQALIGGYLYSVEASYELFNGRILHDRMKGTFVYHNNAAAMFALCLAMGIGAFLAQLERGNSQNSKRWLVNTLDFVLSSKMVLRLSLVIIVIALVMTRSRMGNAGFFIAMTASLALYAIYSTKVRKAVLIVLTSLIVIDIWVLGQWVGLEKVIARLEATQISKAERVQVEKKLATEQVDFNFNKKIQQEESVEERTLPINYAPEALKKFTFFGSGAGTFYSIFPEFRPTDSQGYYDHAHNDYIELATDYGLVGAFLFASIALSSLWQFSKTIRTRNHPTAKGISLGALMAVTYIALHSLVDFNLQIPSNALLVCAILAAGWCAARIKD